ncbi:MAG: type II secretion system F family protein [Anaerolineae bacterium]|nr:type II secretion system F family protein [Phycisphaerae bacterium]
MSATFILLFAAAATAMGWLVSQLVFFLLQRKQGQLRERLSGGTNVLDAAYRPIVLPEEDDTLRALLTRKAILLDFSRKLRQAFPNMTVTNFVTIEFIVIVATFLLVGIVTKSLVLGIALAGAAAAVPVSLVHSRRANRQRLCDDQLPEALDFLARILRAGHSLATALQMAAEELPDPLAAEFRRCYDQHSLGTNLEDTLKEAAQRVDTPDFAFFVTAVLIQRQTGGDLAEVLTNIGAMSRSRIRLQQHVKAITAEGRLVGYILLALPFVFFVCMYAVNPGYAGVLLTTDIGHYLMMAAVGMQLLGLVSIRWIVNVRL